ncbi:MAG: cbb3-type cytochrome oxidase assembly protein CcoS [Halocynthiibacter sp.]
MDALTYLIPIAILLGLVGLLAFLWTLFNRQYDDPDGDSQRILSSKWDDEPKP